MLGALLLLSIADVSTGSDAKSHDWKIKKLVFSAVSIGVAFKDDRTGWSSATDGNHPMKIVKTTDGGISWNPVANQTVMGLMMGIDASSTPSLDVASTGLGANKFSTDGDHFKSSLLGPAVSQSVQVRDGRVLLATGKGVCLSPNGGIAYKCMKADVLQTLGRYASSPSEQVIYLTAGEWPGTKDGSSTAGMQLTSALRLKNLSFVTGDSRLVLEMDRAASFADGGAAPAPPPPPEAGYKAQIVKSTDGGQTWTSLFMDTGNFYFNGIDCFDDTHCVAVGEGFGQDGSASPGARVYVTTDGKTFKLMHHEQADGSSLMAAKAFSPTEHAAGGRFEGGLSLHTSDSGKTYAKKGGHVSVPMAITAFSFVSPTHGFATAINKLQLCSMLEFGSPYGDAAHSVA